MKRLMLVLSGGLLLLAAFAGPVSARSVVIAVSGTGSATVEGCGDATAPPCDGVAIVSVAATVMGSPFDDVKGIKGSAVLSGSLEIPTASLDADTGCYTDATGRLQLGVLRGPNVKSAFDMVVSGSFCPGSLTGTFVVDSSDGDLAAFRDSTGTGILILQHGLDISTAGSCPLAIDASGTIELRR